ncbi:MAG: indolepyruvate oxidoreductase subunit beta [Polyangia bacterium]
MRDQSANGKQGYNILLVGVGGQGIILASDLLSNLGLELGMDVKKSEIHGMAQRGGSVESHVRLGKDVLSPLIPAGQADFVLCVEQVEALRHLDHLAEDGTMLVSSVRVIPPSVTVGGERYPSGDEIEAELKRHTARVAMLELPELMREVGNPRTANIIMLGAMSAFLPFEPEIWKSTLAGFLPEKIVKVNLAAFDVGRREGLAARERMPSG